jgi:transposase
MDELFDLPTDVTEAQTEAVRGRPRVQRPNRAQLELRSIDLDGLLAPDHRARLVWTFTEGLDLGPLYAAIRATEGEPGRPPIDPAILTALWLYATLEGVGSARALERLCDEHDAYRWLCGGVSVNHHTLADFRVGHGAFFDRLLTESVAALIATGSVTLERVAQDGLRVRASAGADSFRRRDALTRALADAEAQVARLRRELDDDPGATSRRVAGARERAARERVERARWALARLPALEARRGTPSHPRSAKADAKASTTDPEATFMRLPASGFRPAYNVQFATDVGSQIIVGVGLVDEVDQGQLAPMLGQLRRRYARAPAQHLVDAGFINRDAITAADACGTAVLMPVPPNRNPARDPHRRHPGDSPAVAAWRARMALPEVQRAYRARAATAECVNALARNRGLRAFGVRGTVKASAVLLWYVLAHNLLRMRSFGAPAAV